MDTIEGPFLLHYWLSFTFVKKYWPAPKNCCLGCDLCRHHRTNLNLEHEHKIATIKFLLGVRDH